MAYKINPKRLFRRGLAFLTAMCLLAYGPVSGGGLKEAKAADTFNIDRGQHFNPLGVYYFGVLNDFNLHGTGYINVTETFGCDFGLPKTAFTRSEPGAFWSKSVQLYLLPAGEGITAENLAKAFNNEDGHIVIPVNSWSTTVSTDSGVFRYSCDNLNLNENDLPASGYYRMAALVYEKDIMSTDLGEGEALPVILTVSRKAFAFSNPADGGDPGEAPYEDPYEGAYTTLNVSVYADGELLDDTSVIVYSEEGQICFGTAPCAVPTGAGVALELRPGTTERYLKTIYRFPALSGGDPVISTVPEDGQIEIELEARGIGASIFGHVTDENGEPVSGAYVSASPKSDGAVSVGTYTDDDGYYNLADLYACEYVVSASKEQYRAVLKEIPEDDMKTKDEITADLVLKEKEAAFSLKFTGNIDEALYNIIMPEILNSGIALSYDVSGDFYWTATDTLSFISDTEEDTASEYRLFFSSDYIPADSLTVAHGTTAEVKLANLAGFRGSARYKNDQYGHPCVLVFDESGNLESDHYSEKDDLAFAVVLPEGETNCTYKAVCYGELTHNTVSDMSYDLMLKNDSSKLLFKDLTLNSGQVTDLGTLELDIYKLEQSSMALLSSVTVSGTAQSSGDVLKVAGHLEDLSSFKLIALRIYGYGTSEFDVTASVKPGSLVINGHVVDATYADNGGWTDLAKLITINEDITGPLDFSCSLSVFDVTDMTVCVEAEVQKEGREPERTKIGEFAASVFPVTLKTMHRTSTGIINCTGHASKNAEVKIWEGEKLLAATYADEHGKYRISVTLPTENDRSYHRLHATSDGHSTEDAVVCYDKNAASVESVALLGGSTTGSWTAHKGFSFEALVDNPEMLTEGSEFHVLCSDGTVVAIPVRHVEDERPYNGVDRSLFVSEEYPFGEKNLLPVKVWFVYSSGKTAANEVSSVSFYGTEAPVYAGGNGTGLSVAGEIIKDPVMNTLYDLVNDMASQLLMMFPQYAKLGAALEKIGIGEMVEIYNQVSEKLDANRKIATAEDEIRMLNFMEKVAAELPSDVDTRRFFGDSQSAKHEGARALDMIDRYRAQNECCQHDSD